MTRIEAIRNARWDRRREIKAARLVICGLREVAVDVVLANYRRGDTHRGHDVLRVPWPCPSVTRGRHGRVMAHLRSLDPARLP